MRLTMTAPAATITAADTDGRTLTGVAIPYGQRGLTSMGPLTIDAGSIRLPENLRTVKLFTEHGRTTPTGYALEATDATDTLAMSFRVAQTPEGDRALLEASEGVRDSLSVELDDVTVHNGHVTAARLVAVAQVAVPAFADAILTAELSDDDQATVAEHAQAILDLTGTEDPEEPNPDGEAPPMEPTATHADPPVAAARPLPAVTASRPARLTAAAQIAELMTGATDPAQVNAALADIVPGGSTGNLFPRPSWIGELWSPEAPLRPIVEAIGVSPMTAMTMEGWKWQQKPEVAPYAGNKAEIPTSPAVVVPASAPGHRIAGGWDLDRIYVDFSTGFVDAFLNAAAADYRRKSQTYFIDGHAAITGPPAIAAAEGFLDDATDLGAQADVLTAVSAIVSFLTGNGANVSFIAMGSGAYSDFLALDTAGAPWWLAKQSSVSLSGSVDIAGLTVAVDRGLASGAVVGGDRDAVSLWETGPINVQAINLPNGGLDLALFGYWSQLVHDPAGLAKCTVTGATGTTARSAAKKS